MTLHTSLLTLSLAAFLLLPTAQADQPTSAQAAPLTERPLLWKVSDADNAVYLLGSFHLLKQDDYPLPTEVDRAFEDAESLLFELSPADMTSPELMAKMQQYMAYEDGMTLSTALPKETLDKLSTMVSASGGSVAALEHSEPWAVSLGLVMGITQAMGFKPELGVDRHLMERAEKAGKPAAGLESIDAQLQALDSAPYAEQAHGLDEFLNDPQKAIKQMSDMHAWWRTGDVDRLDVEMRAEMARETPETYRLLNVDRNNAWLPQVEQRLTDSDKDDTLVVVGALHLLGEDGLVDRLRAKGYTVERVCDSCEVPASE